MSDNEDYEVVIGGRRIQKFEEVILPDGDIALKPTATWLAYRSKRKLQVQLEKSGLPDKVLTMTLDDYQGDSLLKIRRLRQYIQDYEKRFRTVSLYFWSLKNSTQKTTTAAIIGKELLRKGFSVQMVLMSTLMRTLQESAFDKTHGDLVYSWENADFLIIDDAFDDRKSTIYKSGYQIPFLDSFLRKRLDIDRKSTCFTSNIALHDINENFGGHIRNLLIRSVPQPMEFSEDTNDFSINEIWEGID